MCKSFLNKAAIRTIHKSQNSGSSVLPKFEHPAINFPDAEHDAFGCGG